jgi:kynureninase
MHTISSLATNNSLAPYYKNFKVGERILLTGHSHQAWPDCAFSGYKKSFADAAANLDEKWMQAFEIANAVKKYWLDLLNDDDGQIGLGPNTHDLLIKFLSGLDLGRNKIVTTTGEFHTIGRQMRRLQEWGGLEIVFVDSFPLSSLAHRLAQAIDDNTKAVLVSSVMYESGIFIKDLDWVMKKCETFGAKLLVDIYHHLNVAPFDISQMGLQNAYIIGGGYKYCQLGEGNCFIRTPADCKMRPMITGWFSDLFSTLEGKLNSKKVFYPADGNKFSSSTYDPVSHYRAREVFNFFAQQKLTPKFLREVSQHQIELICTQFSQLDLDCQVIKLANDYCLEDRAGFVAFKTPCANYFRSELLKKNISTDCRGNLLRLGPAPYLSNEQISNGVSALKDIVKAIEKSEHPSS